MTNARLASGDTTGFRASERSGAARRSVLDDSLDLTSVSLSQAREFPRFASIAAVGGQLLVAGATEPVVTSYMASPGLTRCGAMPPP
jgi:hypothetical protein